jgi:hypothetical protein
MVSDSRSETATTWVPAGMSRVTCFSTLHYPHLCGGGRKTMGIGIGERSKGGLDRTVGIE